LPKELRLGDYEKKKKKKNLGRKSFLKSTSIIPKLF
jgi:hypothetical protein